MVSNKELLEIVLDDIRYLQREWDQNIANHALRRGSSTLRGLLSQGLLQRAWKAANFEKQPLLVTFSLTDILTAIPKEKIDFAATGGALYKNISIGQSLIVNKTSLSKSDLHTIDSIGLLQETLNLNDYIEAPCIVAEGQLVPRRVLVNYVANALGGTHYNPNRNRKRTGILFSILDRATEKFVFEDKNLIYFELLSIGQTIAKSKDIEYFCKRVESLV